MDSNSKYISKAKKVIQSHITDKNIKSVTQKLKKQIKHIQRPRPKVNLINEIWLYNVMVRGIQNYYQIATHVNIDCNKIGRAVNILINNRLNISRTGRKLTKAAKARYGKSLQVHYIADEQIYPISYVQHKKPMNKTITTYTTETSATNIKLMQQQLHGRSIKYTDNRISLYNAQKGKCAITGKEFETTEEIHCHHITPKSKGGTDEYENLTLVTETVHKLIHATK